MSQHRVAITKTCICVSCMALQRNILFDGHETATNSKTGSNVTI